MTTKLMEHDVRQLDAMHDDIMASFDLIESAFGSMLGSPLWEAVWQLFDQTLTLTEERHGFKQMKDSHGCDVGTELGWWFYECKASNRPLSWTDEDGTERECQTIDQFIESISHMEEKS